MEQNLGTAGVSFMQMLGPGAPQSLHILYDNMIHPLIPYAMRGAVWYQGEADAYGEEADVYDCELCELIRVWREDFKDSSLPFYVIQIADYYCKEDIARDFEGWKRLQTAQVRVQDMTHNVTTVVSADVCENDVIHPPTKTLLSKRLAEIIMEK